MNFEQAIFIEDKSTFVIVALGIFTIGLILWLYKINRKEKQNLKDDTSERPEHSGVGISRLIFLAVFLVIIIIVQILERIGINIP